MNVAEALIVREDNGSGGRIGSRNGIVGAGTGAGAIGSPTCYEIMTLIVLRAVHPVTVIREVLNILGLSAVTVAQDNADSVLGNIALELSLAVFILSRLSHCGTGPFAVDRFACSVPSVDICAAPTEVVGQQEAGFNRIIGSRFYRTAGTVGVPAGDLVVTELVLGAVHPVTVIREVLDILGLLAVTVAQDNAGSALGNIASELSLAILILSGLSLSGARPCAVKLIAVIIPCIYICLTPTEVIGQQEGALGIRIRVGTGSRGGVRINVVEFYIVVTLIILIGHIYAGRTIERNIDSLLAAVVDDVVSNAGRNFEGESLFAVFVHTDGGHRNTGPLNGLLGIGPIININSAEALVVGEDDGAALFGIRLCGLLIRSSRDNDRSRSGRLYRLYGLFLADIILDAHLSDITLDQSSVDNSDEAVAVYISRELLLLGQGCVINRSAHNNNRVSAVNCTVAANITEDIGLGRIGRSRRIGGLGSFVVLIENSNAGGTDRTLDLALGYGKGVAGDSVLICARGQLVICQSDILRGGAAEVDDHRTGITSLDVSSTAVVSGAVLGLTDEVVMELVDRLGGSVRPRGLARFT